MIDLSGTVFLLIELEQEVELILDNPQIEQLNELQNRETFTSDEAEKILVNIEENILTPEQLIWMDSKIIERRSQVQNGERRGPFGPNSGQQQRGESNREAFLAAIKSGQLPNTFQRPEATRRLTSLIEGLEQKLE